MQDRDLDKIIDRWAEDETASAPEMRPTAEMYEQVASLGRRRARGVYTLRRVVWTTGAAALVLFVLFLTLIQFSPLVTPGTGRQIARVRQRVAFVAPRGSSRGDSPPEGKGAPDESPQFRQLVLEVHDGDLSVVRSVNVLAPYERPVVLTADDSYRLVLEPAATRYVYVYQRAPGGALALLYPEEATSQQENPMQAAKTVYLPAQPNGFYLEGEEGPFRLYVVAAERPRSELETFYVRYSARGIRLGRRKNLALLSDRLEALAGGQIEGASGWVFEFEVR